MTPRFKKLGIALMAAGLVFALVGGFTFLKTQEGAASLQAFSTAEDVSLSYNEAGQLVDRGKTEGADAIMSLLVNDWKYPVVAADLNPNDPIVNTASEYMYEMATVSYHTLHGTQTVVLDKNVDYNGKTYLAGTYQVEGAGRYFSQYDRLDPLDGPAREQAWSGTAHGLIASLGVGTVTASALQMGLGLAGLAVGFGGTMFLFGIGLIWASRLPEDKKVTEATKRPDVKLDPIKLPI